VAESGALRTGSVPPAVVAAHTVLAAGELLAPLGVALAAGAVAAAPVAGNPSAAQARRLGGNVVVRQRVGGWRLPPDQGLGFARRLAALKGADVCALGRLVTRVWAMTSAVSRVLSARCC
jgi:hypothetical protein